MSILPTDELFLKRFNKTQRQFQVQKLYTQIEILERRIKKSFKAYLSEKNKPLGETKKSFKKEHFYRDSLILDLETYYTVAEDLLKLIGLLFPGEEKKKELKKDSTYKTICKIRNWVIRHSYDKETGDPYTGFSYSEETGVSLQGGTPFGEQLDPGFKVNSRNLQQLLDSLLDEFTTRFPRSLVAAWYNTKHLL